MAQSLISGDEPRPERGDHRGVVEHRAVDHLDGGAGRILEGADLLDATDVGILRRESFERHPGAVQSGLEPLERGVVPDLPAHRGHPVDLTGRHDDPGGPLVHPQVERVRIGPRPLGEPQHTKRKVPPAIQVRGRNSDVAKAFQLSHGATAQIIARSGPCGSTPSELSAEAW